MHFCFLVSSIHLFCVLAFVTMHNFDKVPYGNACTILKTNFNAKRKERATTDHDDDDDEDGKHHCQRSKWTDGRVSFFSFHFLLVYYCNKIKQNVRERKEEKWNTATIDFIVCVRQPVCGGVLCEDNHDVCMYSVELFNLFIINFYYFLFCFAFRIIRFHSFCVYLFLLRTRTRNGRPKRTNSDYNKYEYPLFGPWNSILCPSSKFIEWTDRSTTTTM